VKITEGGYFGVSFPHTSRNGKKGSMLQRTRPTLPHRVRNRLTQFFSPSTVHRAAQAACQPLEQRLLLSVSIDPIDSQTIAEGSP
jgi:hypothetical protein